MIAAIPLQTTSLDMLRADLAGIILNAVPDGSGHGGEDYRPGWITGLENVRLFLRDAGIDVMDRYPALRNELDAFGEYLGGDRQLQKVMVNRLSAGKKLDRHRDGYPDNDRFHLPVITNDGVTWWDEYHGRRHLTEGFWHGPMPYCQVLHSVANEGITDRVHVVADYSQGY